MQAKMLKHRITGALYLYDQYLARHEDIVEATDDEIAAFHGVEDEVVEAAAPKRRAPAKKAEEPAAPPAIPAPPAAE